MKICHKCGLKKSLVNFCKDKKAKDGHQYTCKACDSKSSAKYRLENKEKINKHYQDNKEKIIKNKAKYYQDNKENLSKTMAKYYQDNKEKIKKGVVKWQQENKEYYAKYQAKYQKDHPEVGRASSRKRRAMKQEIKEQYTKEDEAYTRDLFMNKCFNCDCKENLTIDHHQPLSKGFPLARDNAVVLCKSCNSSKNDKLPEDFYNFYDLMLIEKILA